MTRWIIEETFAVVRTVTHMVDEAGVRTPQAAIDQVQKGKAETLKDEISENVDQFNYDVYELVERKPSGVRRPE